MAGLDSLNHFQAAGRAYSKETAMLASASGLIATNCSHPRRLTWTLSARSTLSLGWRGSPQPQTEHNHRTRDISGDDGWSLTSYWRRNGWPCLDYFGFIV
jgi:hypothetical protein